MPDKSVLEKLQLKEGRSLLILNPPESYLELIRNQPAGTQVVFERQPVDILQVFIRSKADLEDLFSEVGTLLKPGGLFWISYPKLTSNLKGDIHRDIINRIAQEHGWIGIAMISIDKDWSALRLKPL